MLKLNTLKISIALLFFISSCTELKIEGTHLSTEYLNITNDKTDESKSIKKVSKISCKVIKNKKYEICTLFYHFSYDKGNILRTVIQGTADSDLGINSPQKRLSYTYNGKKPNFSLLAENSFEFTQLIDKPLDPKLNLDKKSDFIGVNYNFEVGNSYLFKRFDFSKFSESFQFKILLKNKKCKIDDLVYQLDRSGNTIMETITSSENRNPELQNILVNHTLKSSNGNTFYSPFLSVPDLHLMVLSNVVNRETFYDLSNPARLHFFLLKTADLREESQWLVRNYYKNENTKIEIKIENMTQGYPKDILIKHTKENTEDELSYHYSFQYEAS